MALVGLTLKDENIYSAGRIIRFDNGEELLIRDLVDYEAQENDDYHKLKSRDELTLLAYKFYRNKVKNPGKYWWLIADANLIFNPLELDDLVGTEILIPNILNFKLTI